MSSERQGLIHDKDTGHSVSLHPACFGRPNGPAGSAGRPKWVKWPLVPPSLASIFADHAPTRPPPGTDAALEATLSHLHALGRAAWPSLNLTPERFVRHVAERLTPEPTLDGALAALHAADLYLACACTDGLPEALALFERDYLSSVGSHLLRIDRSPAFADEVRQLLREKLLLPLGGPPRIGEYTGRGALASWVHVATIRTALNLRRGDKKQVDASEAESQQLLPDPELQFIKQRYQADFRMAFQAAIDGLEADQRLLLRLHFLDGLTTSQIGALHQVDKSTVSRWLATARRTLFEETQRLLRERLSLESSELDSLMGLVQSQLDVSLERVLRRTKSSR
jgi:RNA polymerase sigma-70 factor